MNKAKTAMTFGSWPSTVNAEVVSAKGTRLGHMQVFGEFAFWLESRPSEKGRGVIVQYADGVVSDFTGQDISVGSRAHEYGGGDFLATEKGMFFSHSDDQCIWLQTWDGELRQVTVQNDKKGSHRFTDFSLAKNGLWLFAVREDHNVFPEKNEIVRIDLDSENWGAQHVVESGADFYSNPRVSPDGDRLLWLSWNCPQMPWDGTELWVADVHLNGTIDAQHRVVGGSDESVYQPEWSRDGILHFISDRNGWWNLYSLRDGVINALTPTNHDFGLPQWVFGTNNYCFDNEDGIYSSYFEDGQQFICHIIPDTGHFKTLKLPFREISGQIHCYKDQLITIAASPTIASDVFIIDRKSLNYKTAKTKTTSPASSEELSVAKPIQFQSASGYIAHAFYYEPMNAEYCGLENELPPLIVMSHGGPTAAASTSLNWAIQFWTTRGFAVVDVNYGGSTGYGRDYRELLHHQWGINDANDCVYAARFLVEKGLVDSNRLAIRGGSAGGFTTLCALTFFDDFSAGMTRYGVVDLEALATESHKFERHYLTNLVGPLPETKEQYYDRSPIHHADQLSCPLLILQGALDKVVPPQQARRLAAALSEKQIPYVYIEFENEAHGFRQKENIERALNAELTFYRKVFHIDAKENLPELEFSLEL